MNLQPNASVFDSGLPAGEAVRSCELERQIERLLPCLRLAVVFGGDKSAPGSVLYQTDNSRPWKSYEEVAVDIAESLKRIGFRHVELMPDDQSFTERLRRTKSHMAWLNTGGVQGYNSTAHTASMLEMLGIPYVGHCPLAATTLDNKHSFKAEAICAGLPTARFSVWDMTRGKFRPEINSRFSRAFSGYDGPFVVKPVSGRASLHVHWVGTRDELPGAIDRVYQETKNLVLIEEYLPGREFCVAVSGPITSHRMKIFELNAPFAFSTVERILDHDEHIFTSMDARPITNKRVRALDGAVESVLIRQLLRLGTDVFREFNLSSITRVDVRAGIDGQPRILEANPKPDLKRPGDGKTNLISAGLPACGMDYDDLILSLFADRVNYLLRHRKSSANQIVELVNQHSRSVEKGAAPDRNDRKINEAVTNANVRVLEGLISAAKYDAKGAEKGPSNGHSARRTGR